MKTKKILSIALACALALSVTAFALANNSSNNNPSSESTETEETVKTHNFENTYYNLKKNNKLNIGYLGGSITYGVGASDPDTHSWASLVTEWFKAKFPEAEIVGNNVGIGGTGTVFGQYRIIKDFKLKSETDKPDLIFLEFAINDSYDGTTAKEARNNMQTILTSIYNYAPCADVVILLTTDSGKSEEGGTSGDATKNIQKAHQEIADAYGIPTIDIGGMLLDDMSKQSNDGQFISVWGKYFPVKNPVNPNDLDPVHPNDLGHLKYASYITHYLDSVFSKKLKAADNLTVAYKPEDTSAFGTALENPHTANLVGKTPPKGFSINGEGVISTNTDWTEGENDSFKIRFEGTSLSLWTNVKPKAGDVVVTIDGEITTEISLLEGNPYAKIKLVAKGLEDKTHTAEIKVMPAYDENGNKIFPDVVIDRFCLTGRNLNSGVTIVNE